MKKSQQQVAQVDAADEKYQGPSATVTGLGYTSALHFAFNVVAILGLGTLAFAFHDKANGIIERIRKFASKGEGTFLKGLTGIKAGDHPLRKLLSTEQLPEFEKLLGDAERGTFQRLPNEILHLIPEPIHQWVGADKWDKAKVNAGLFFAGVGMAISTIGSIVVGFIHGKSKSNVAKDQLNRVQDNLLVERYEKEVWREKYKEAKLALEDLKTAKAAENGTLRVAKDDTPEVTKESPIVAASAEPAGAHQARGDALDSGNGQIEAPHGQEPVFKPYEPGKKFFADRGAHGSHTEALKARESSHEHTLA